MTSGSRTKTQRPKAERPKPDPTPKPAPPPAPEPEPQPVADDASTKVFARADDIEEVETEEVYLPMLQRWVQVRVLETPEAARLEYLPQYNDMAKLMTDLGANLEGEPEGGKRKSYSEAEYAEQNIRYYAAIAHVAVRNPDASPEAVWCSACEYEHPSALWSFRQTRRLHQVDLAQISDAALSAGIARVLRPFSKDATPPDSSPPADTGT